MRPVLLFISLVVVAVAGFFVAQKLGLFGPDAIPVTSPDEPAALEDEGASPPGQPPAAEAPDPSLVPPGFDIVRVTKDGSVVVAGRGAPGAEVTLYANGTVLATEVVGPDGAWTILTDTPLDGGPVEFTLSSRTPDGFMIIGEESVIVFVPEDTGDKPLIMRTMPGAPSVILQHPDDPDEAFGPLILETVDYDSSGRVLFSGRAETGSTVQIYANQAFVAQSVTGEDGKWTVAASIRPGRYTLQVIQLDQFGKPAYAIEVPFERASYDDVLLADGNVIVQPGNSLWVIARRAYGEGTQYTIIFAANADQIRDPDLIFPGQIFVVPEENGLAEAEEARSETP